MDDFIGILNDTLGNILFKAADFNNDDLLNFTEFLILMRALDLEFNLLDFHYEQFFDLRADSTDDQKMLNLQEFISLIVLSGYITEEMINKFLNFYNIKE